MLRALLAMRLDYVHATKIAARIGQRMALLFGIVGLLFNPFLVFIALFVRTAAAQEVSMVKAKSALNGIALSFDPTAVDLCLSGNNGEVRDFVRSPHMASWHEPAQRA